MISGIGEPGVTPIAEIYRGGITPEGLRWQKMRREMFGAVSEVERSRMFRFRLLTYPT